MCKPAAACICTSLFNRLATGCTPVAGLAAAVAPVLAPASEAPPVQPLGLGAAPAGARRHDLPRARGVAGLGTPSKKPIRKKRERERKEQPRRSAGPRGGSAPRRAPRRAQSSSLDSSSSPPSSSSSSSSSSPAASLSSSSFFRFSSSALSNISFSLSLVASHVALRSASASAGSSLMSTLSKMVPAFTCQISKPATPKDLYLPMDSSSVNSGLSIIGCSHGPLYAGFSMRFGFQGPLYSGLGIIGGSHSPSSSSSQSSGFLASGSAISLGMSS
mmetsp:Transcript_23647/g.79434  ORF Transcript_23647/g.79434 Transcript_23647/m.79434 type:complete len:274 (+) Transcript_23647:322-1143(+)